MKILGKGETKVFHGFGFEEIWYWTGVYNTVMLFPMKISFYSIVGCIVRLLNISKGKTFIKMSWRRISKIKVSRKICSLCLCAYHFWPVSNKIISRGSWGSFKPFYMMVRHKFDDEITEGKSAKHKNLCQF